MDSGSTFSYQDRLAWFEGRNTERRPDIFSACSGVSFHSKETEDYVTQFVKTEVLTVAEPLKPSASSDKHAFVCVTTSAKRPLNSIRPTYCMRFGTAKFRHRTIENDSSFKQESLFRNLSVCWSNAHLQFYKRGFACRDGAYLGSVPNILSGIGYDGVPRDRFLSIP